MVPCCRILNLKGQKGFFAMETKKLSVADLDLIISNLQVEVSAAKQRMETEVKSLNEQIELYGRLRNLQNGVANVVATSVEKPRRGRPKMTGETKVPPLPKLLVAICAEAQHPMKIDEITKELKAKGWNTSAQDPGNMVYQTLLRLIHKGVFAKDEEQAYKYVGNVA